MLKMTTFKNLTVLAATAAFVAAGYKASAQDDLDDLLNDLAGSDTAVEKKAEEPAKPAEPAVATPAPAPAENASADILSDDPAPAPAQTATAEPVAEAKDKDAAPAPEAAAADAGTKAEEPAKVAADDGQLKPAEKYYGDNKKATDAELRDALRKTQELRFKAFKLQAEREIAEAEKCMAGEEFQEAARHYALAMKLLNSSPSLSGLRKKCQEGIAEGLYRAALQENATGRRERALKLIQKAIDCRHPKARRQHEAWIAEGDPDANKADVSEITHRRNDEDFKAKRAEYKKHFKRAQHLLSVRELDKARDEVELVLHDDPYNQEALRLLDKIHQKRRTIMASEREVTRKGMMAEVDKAWRPNYAIDVRDVEVVADTNKKPTDEKDETASPEQEIIKRMKDMRLPAVSFKPPATLSDAIETFSQLSKDFDRPDIPLEQRGFNFFFKPQEIAQAPADAEAGADNGSGFGVSETAEAKPSAERGPVLPIITASGISFYDALKLVCEAVNYKFTVKGPMVTIMHKDASVEEMHTRSYPVLSSFMDRMDSAQTDVQDLRASGNTGFNLSTRPKASNDDGENKEQDWKEFFRILGVEWPEGSSLMYIKTLGKLQVKNTLENLAALEHALNQLNIKPTLIEIEARFVEVCQDDLNSLGFEWILNSDYSLGLGRHASKLLGIKNGQWDVGSANPPSSGAEVSGGNSNPGVGGGSSFGGTSSGGAGTTINPGVNGGSASGSSLASYAASKGAPWIRGTGAKGNVGFGATGGDTGYGMNNRYLSTLGNHISGEGYSTNDQFMRVNAFLGSADLSMILHMLSQRSDTDLLSAPKVLTRSNEQAVIKVVTMYRYPDEYDVQLQSSRSGGSDYGGGSQSAILAIVEPTNFKEQEVGVILDVTPSLTDNGNLIDLQLNTKVIDEPTWKNYGMRIPFTGNSSSLESFQGVGEIFTGVISIFTQLGANLSDEVKEAFAIKALDSAGAALDSLGNQGSANMTYYDAPMEQPFFHIREIDSKVSVYPGATIVMGGLITEQRKAMDDKVPFLGDIPFIGRLFRSHSEYSSKRNLLIFLTTRLVDAHGREIKISANNGGDEAASIKPAPEKE